MKRLFKYILIAAVASCSASCDAMLDETTYDFVSPETLGDSDDAAIQYVNGVYSALNTDLFADGKYLYMTNMDCDYASGADWAFGNVGAGNPVDFWGKNVLWQGTYNMIGRINRASKFISEMKNITEQKKVAYIGQLKFLKAWGYFNLVRNYGPVPIINVSIADGGSKHNARQSIETVYAHIIELLKDAEALPSVKEPGYIEGFASRGAAKALLAKVYITIASSSLSGAQLIVKGGPAKNSSGAIIAEPVPLTHTKSVVAGYENFIAADYFKLARDKASELIHIDKDYSLFTTYMDVWKISNRNKGEHIWSLQAKTNEKGMSNIICYNYVGILLPTGILEGNWYGMREHWYSLFEPTDERVVDGVVHRWPSGISNGKISHSYYPQSYQDKVANKEAYNSNGDRFDGSEYYQTDPGWSLAKLTKFSFVSDRTVMNGDFHFPLLRYPDVLLIFAEAENELKGGPTVEAYDAINSIRERAGATPYEGLNQLQFRSMVIEERARELAYEADRRYDLFRWGVYIPVMNAIDVDEHKVLKRRSEKNLLFPIPTEEIDANDLINENNKGWS